MNASLFRHAIHIAAILGLCLSAAMLFPAMLDLYYDHSDWQVFATAAFVTSGLSATTFMATRAGRWMVSTTTRIGKIPSG